MGVVNEKVINVCCTWRKETTDSEPFQGNFNAESDKFLLPIEKDYNLLTKFPFNDYVSLLYQYNNSSETLLSSSAAQKRSITFDSFDDSFSIDAFSSFIATKILSNDMFYNYTIENDNKTLPIFKEYLSEIYRDLNKNYMIYSEDKFSIIKRYHIMALGLIYCRGTKKDKLHAFFNFFKNDNNNFHKSQKINKFLIALFMIPSLNQVNVRMKLAAKFPFLGDISKEDMISILDAFELCDMERLVGIVNKIWFKEKDFMTYEELSELFEKNEMWWMFTASGIRANLEKNNDNKMNNLKRMDGTMISEMTSKTFSDV